MKTKNCICSCCGKVFQKTLSECNRRAKKGSPLYCSRSCAGKKNLQNFGSRINHTPPAPKFKANPFRYYLRNCKKRFQDCDLTLPYLEEIWINQKGLCPYSKVSLVLNTHMLRNPDIRYTASLDRIDSTKGYIQGNVQFISMAINFLKSTMTHQQTAEFLQIIAKNLTSIS